MVLAEINAILTERVNTSISLNWISWADFADMYSLMFASGEEFDAIFTVSWAYYIQEAQRNGFLELTPELLQTYAPMTWQNTPASSWEEVRVNGGIYMIPQDHNEWPQRQIMLRGDLMAAHNIPPVSKMADLTAYFEIIAENETIAPFDLFPSDSVMVVLDMVMQEKGWSTLGGWFYQLVYDYNSPGGELISLFDQPELLEVIKLMREWNDRGFIPRNTLTNPELSFDMFMNGLTSVCFQNMNTADRANSAFKDSNPDWYVTLVDGTFGQNVLPYPAIAGGMGISRTSRHPERVLMVTDLLRNDKELNWLAQRGIKGVHWDLAGDGSDENLIVSGPRSGSYGPDMDCFSWGPWRNSSMQITNADAVDGFKELNDSLAARKVNHPVQAFNIDDENIRAEMAVITSLEEQYLFPLLLGFVDPETGLAEYKAALQQAGFERVREELQRQINEYLS